MDYLIKNKAGAYKLLETLNNGMLLLEGYLHKDIIKRNIKSCTEKFETKILKSDVDTPPIYKDGQTIASGLQQNGLGWKIKYENGIITEYENGIKI